MTEVVFLVSDTGILEKRKSSFSQFTTVVDPMTFRILIRNISLVDIQILVVCLAHEPSLKVMSSIAGENSYLLFPNMPVSLNGKIHLTRQR